MSESDGDGEAVDGEQHESEWASDSEPGRWHVFFFQHVGFFMPASDSYVQQVATPVSCIAVALQTLQLVCDGF